MLTAVVGGANRRCTGRPDPGTRAPRAVDRDHEHTVTAHTFTLLRELMEHHILKRPAHDNQVRSVALQDVKCAVAGLGASNLATKRGEALCGSARSGRAVIHDDNLRAHLQPSSPRPSLGLAWCSCGERKRSPLVFTPSPTACPRKRVVGFDLPAWPGSHSRRLRTRLSGLDGLRSLWDECAAGEPNHPADPASPTTL